ncbi:MAG: IS3 family transposase [Boseongicola sp.]|nr:IS3 family transposase [Boseongicola sp.]
MASSCHACGYQSMTVEHRHRGLRLSAKNVRRIMAENGLTPLQRRRYNVTTERDHDSPVYPNVALN